MNTVKWQCPMCGHKNTDSIGYMDGETALIETKACGECAEVSELIIALQPVVTHVDLKD